jgi:thiamine-phosphate pyrophosphorylase
LPASSPLPFTVLLVTDRRATSLPLPEAVARALGGDGRGVAVLLRDKDLPQPERAGLARALRRVTTDVGARLLVHGDVALARAVGADGIHVADDPDARALLAEADSDWILGASAHSACGVHEAAACGAHYATLSPILPSPGKAAPGQELGWGALRGPWPVPVLALGGLGPASLPTALQAGAWGIAAIRAFLDPDTGAAAVRSCREATDR